MLNRQSDFGYHRNRKLYLNCQNLISSVFFFPIGEVAIEVNNLQINTHTRSKAQHLDTHTQTHSPLTSQKARRRAAVIVLLSNSERELISSGALQPAGGLDVPKTVFTQWSKWCGGVRAVASHGHLALSGPEWTSSSAVKSISAWKTSKRDGRGSQATAFQVDQTAKVSWTAEADQDEAFLAGSVDLWSIFKSGRLKTD